jgi:hypothetical protein
MLRCVKVSGAVRSRSPAAGQFVKHCRSDRAAQPIMSPKVSDSTDVIRSFGTRTLCLTEQCLQDLTQSGIPFEDAFRHSHQLLSICLAGLRIGCSGFDAAQKREIGKQVFLLGGNFMATVDESTTLLIAARMMSTKVYRAIGLGKPIVSSEWIQLCFRDLTNAETEPFILPKFAGCIITSSDLTPKQRTELSKYIRREGGVWSDVFDASVHCLVAHALTPSKKILCALTGNVPIVTPEWFRRQTSSVIPPHPFILNGWCVTGDSPTLFDGLTFSVDTRLQDYQTLSECIQISGGRIGQPAKFVVAPHGTQ